MRKRALRYTYTFFPSILHPCLDICGTENVFICVYCIIPRKLFYFHVLFHFQSGKAFLSTIENE